MFFLPDFNPFFFSSWFKTQPVFNSIWKLFQLYELQSSEDLINQQSIGFVPLLNADDNNPILAEVA